MVAITFAEAKAIVWDAEAATWHLACTRLSSSAMKDETHFFVLRGAKQPDPGHPDPNLVIVPEGPGVIRALCRFLEFVEDAGSLLSVLVWCDLPVGEQPIDSRKSLLYRLL